MIDFLPYLVVLGTSLWVLSDARSLGVRRRRNGGFFNMGPAGWFFSCLLFWALAFPAYLVKRRTYRRVAAEAAEAPAGVPELDLISQLSALADSYSQGALTEDEFQAQKKALVHRMAEEPPADEKG